MPGLGNPALAAQLTVAAYAITAAACALNAWRAREGIARGLWAGLGVLAVAREHADADRGTDDHVDAVDCGRDLLVGHAARQQPGPGQEPQP